MLEELTVRRSLSPGCDQSLSLGPPEGRFRKICDLSCHCTAARNILKQEHTVPDPITYGRSIPPGLGINLLVPNVERSARFQVEVLGAQIRYREEHFAIMSGLAPQSVAAIRPDFPRWVRYMKENGVTEIPDSPLAGHSHAVNMASLLIRQKAGFKGDSITHELRNLTGVRPWKL